MLPEAVQNDILLNIDPFTRNAQRAVTAMNAIYHGSGVIMRWYQMHLCDGHAPNPEMAKMPLSSTFYKGIIPFTKCDGVNARPAALRWLLKMKCYAGALRALSTVHTGDRHLFGASKTALAKLFEDLIVKMVPFGPAIIASLQETYFYENKYNHFSIVDMANRMEPWIWIQRGDMQPLTRGFFRRSFTTRLMTHLLKDVMYNPEQDYSGWMINLCKRLPDSVVVTTTFTDLMCTGRVFKMRLWWMGLMKGVQLELEQYERILRCCIINDRYTFFFTMFNGIGNNCKYPHPLAVYLHGLERDHLCAKGVRHPRWIALSLLYVSMDFKNTSCFIYPAMWYVSAVGYLLAACDHVEYGGVVDPYREEVMQYMDTRPGVAKCLRSWMKQASDTGNAYAAFVKKQEEINPLHAAKSQNLPKKRVYVKNRKFVK